MEYPAARTSECKVTESHSRALCSEESLAAGLVPKSDPLCLDAKPSCHAFSHQQHDWLAFVMLPLPSSSTSSNMAFAFTWESEGLGRPQRFVGRPGDGTFAKLLKNLWACSLRGSEACSDTSSAQREFRECDFAIGLLLCNGATSVFVHLVEKLLGQDADTQS